MAEKGSVCVCVTGAGGYVASWVVKLLLSKGYTVHGTVRDPRYDKHIHLKKLEKASKNLKLFKTDLVDYNSICAAVIGCNGVFHITSPVPSGTVPNPEILWREISVVSIFSQNQHPWPNYFVDMDYGTFGGIVVENLRIYHFRYRL